MNSQQKLKNNFKQKLGSPPLLLLLTIISIIAIAISIYFEYQARQKDYLTLLNKQATLFINSLSSSVQNAITAADRIEADMNDRIIANVKITAAMDQRNPLSKRELEGLLQMSGMEALQLYNEDGKLIQQVTKDPLQTYAIPFPVINARIMNSLPDTILTLYDETRIDNEFMAVFVARKNGGLIVAIIGTEAIQSLRSTLGIGYYLKRFQAEKNIEYVVIQNSETIVAGSFNGYNISTFSRDTLLNTVLTQDSIQSRIVDYDQQLIFETISPFKLNDQPFGVLRLGLSMNEYQRLKKDINKRLFIFGVALIVFGLIFVNFLISYRHRKLLHRDLSVLQDYTNTILENLASGVISVDQNGLVQSANKKALQLINTGYQEVIHKPFTVLPAPFRDAIEQKLYGGAAKNFPSKHEYASSGRKINITLRTNIIKDEAVNKTCILLIDDVTDQTQLEEQVRRNQRLTAMRNLASAVAHEIINPLNAIKLIVDLIKKKNKSIEGTEIYDQHLNTVQNEIHRISSIVDQYLRFARPPEMKLTSVNFPGLMDEIAALYESSLKEKNIRFQINMESHKPIQGDVDQLKQVFINLVKNAEQAIEPPGEINISGKAMNGYCEIRVSDTGTGIPEKDLNSIFDFHFTTKKNSNGIGLSVVQQIMEAHRGKIDVESVVGRGTVFILKFPFS